MMKKTAASIVALLVCTVALPAFAAPVFNPDFIITDAEATETTSFDADGIQLFLAVRGSGLANLRINDVDGVERRAADIIMNASLRNTVSPRFLLALLQREQSLITDPSPSQKQLDWATGYGICDSCSMDDPALQKYRGFAIQVEDAAGNFRYLMDNGASLTYLRARDVATVIDGTTVTPRTRATAILYNYTPHLIAQENFFNTWQKYFVRRLPNGVLVKVDGERSTWLIQYGVRREIKSNAVLLSRFNAESVITAEANDLLAYVVGPEIKFSNYSLLRSPRGTVYLIVDDERRGIASREVFRKLGFNPDEVDDATWDDLNQYHEGAPITLASAYPFGALLRDPKSGGVFYVQVGIKHPLYGPELLSLYFKSRRVQKSTASELEGFTTGEPIGLRDGELVTVTGSQTVYVISDGTRLPIPSATLFEKQGWQWKNVVTVSEKVLELQPLGDPFDPENESSSVIGY
jgi:hypothetical protein